MKDIRFSIFSMFILYLPLGFSHECQVSIKNGNIVGRDAETVNPNQNICSYLGIPFAVPPVGPLRFKSPVPARDWTGTLNATKQPNWCPQIEGDIFPKPPDALISEDCLYLNVFQPKLENLTYASLPVMIFIHGGGFTSGSADTYTPPRLLAKGDIILVVIQFRVGILGFLSTGDLVSPGNYGLKDQALAIRWVHENIAAFGGNPNQVTIFGESAGAASAMYQMLSPMNEGLIHGMIAQSGTALSFWAIDRTPLATASLAASTLGCPNATSEVLVECMRNVDWKEFLALPISPLPVVEPFHNEAFINFEPLDIMQYGNIPKIPVIVGANKHDGSFLLANLYMAEIGPQGLDKNPDFMRNQLMPYLLRYLKNDEDSANRAVSSSLEMTYLGGVNRSSWDASMPGMVDFMTASVYKAPALHSAEILSKRGLAVYLYSFEHHSSLSILSPIANGPNPPPVEFGIGHADDLMYLFDLSVPFSPDDTKFSEIFLDLWTNFAKSGDPTPNSRNVSERWLPYNASNESFMKLNATPTTLSDYYSSWRPNGFDWN